MQGYEYLVLHFMCLGLLIKNIYLPPYLSLHTVPESGSFGWRQVRSHVKFDSC